MQQSAEIQLIKCLLPLTLSLFAFLPHPFSLHFEVLTEKTRLQAVETSKSTVGSSI